jgi:hypothetical protein
MREASKDLVQARARQATAQAQLSGDVEQHMRERGDRQRRNPAGEDADAGRQVAPDPLGGGVAERGSNSPGFSAHSLHGTLSL